MAVSEPRSNPMRGRVVSEGETPASLGNVANIITVLRILMAPVFVWLLLSDAGADGTLRWVAAGLFLVAILTDSVDGFLARRLNLVTDFGKLVDPIADKILVGAALVGLSVLGELSWWITGLILLREIGITVFRFIALRDHVIPASLAGKVKTWAQSVAVTAMLLPLDRLVGEWWLWAGWVLAVIALVLTVYSGIEYLVQAARAARSARTAP